MMIADLPTFFVQLVLFGIACGFGAWAIRS